MTAAVYVVRIVACTNAGFIEVDKRDPVGLYVGNLGRAIGAMGRSWLPMSLVAAELSSTYEDAVQLELSARHASEGFSFEIVRLAEPENPVHDELRVFSPEAIERARRPNTSPVTAWLEATQHEDGTLTITRSGAGADVDRALAGAALGLSTTPTWLEVAERAATMLERASKLGADLVTATRYMDVGSTVVKRLAGSIRSHAAELEGVVSQWDTHTRGGQHVGARPNLAPSWVTKFERWARELREVVAGIPESS